MAERASAAAPVNGLSTSKRSASSDSEPPAESSTNSADPVRKKRRPTHTLRKEEKEKLLKEVAELESQARELKERAEKRMTEKELLNVILREKRHEQQLSFAVAQSAVSAFMNIEDSNPLHTYIHLGKDWGERRKTLTAMKETKIRSAFEYVKARSHFLDPLKPHNSEERFENSSGDLCCARFETIQFEGVESVKQVYDALHFYILNIEISVSEHLGHITLREDYDSVDKSISNFRLLSAPCGINVEMNLVTFTKYFDSHELSGGKPCGVITFDCVDKDELYPYSPKERVRKDVAQVIVLTPHTRPKRNGAEGEEELVVVMAIGKFLKLRHAGFDIPPPVVQALRDGMCWSPVLVTTVNKLLHPEFFSNAIPLRTASSTRV